MTTTEQVSLPDHAERRRLRVDAGHSMPAVAARVGVSPAALQRWEVDRDPGSEEHLTTYAGLLGLMAAGAELPDLPAETTKPAKASTKKPQPRAKGPRLPDPERRVAAREAAGVTVEQLAAALRVRTEDVAAWERGDLDPQGAALAAYAALLRAYSVYLVPPGPEQAPERLALADLLVSPEHAAALLGLSDRLARTAMRRHGVTERRGYLPQDVAFVLRERGGEPDGGSIGDARRGAATYRRLRAAISGEVSRALPGVNADAAGQAADAALVALGREFADVPFADGSCAAS